MDLINDNHLNHWINQLPTQSNTLYSEKIGSYRIGEFYSTSISGLPHEYDLVEMIGVGRNNSESLWSSSSGGIQKTLRLIIFLHETAHYVHDLSLGMCMEMDYLNDEALSALLYLIQNLPKDDRINCPILANKNQYRLHQIDKIHNVLSFLEEKEALMNCIFYKPPSFIEDIIKNYSFLKIYQDELNQLSGASLLEGLVAAKTHIALVMRIKDKKDCKYLSNIKDDIPVLPEKLPLLYNVARRLFDFTIGKMLKISPTYLNDDWPNKYSTSLRAIGDEAFIYLTDMALHIPPFEYSINRIKNGYNQWIDFIPAYRFIKEIVFMLEKRFFPPLQTAPKNFYKTVFDFIAKELNWPTFNETNNAWKEKLINHKLVTEESADEYRIRILSKKDFCPADIVVSDSVKACLSHSIPIFHLTPNGLKFITSYNSGSITTFTNFELPDMQPYHVMTDLHNYKDLFGKSYEQQIFRQEIVYRIISRTLKRAILYDSYFTCPLQKLGCNIASKNCETFINFETIPQDGCCIKFYMQQKSLSLSNFFW